MIHIFYVKKLKNFMDIEAVNLDFTGFSKVVNLCNGQKLFVF